MLALVENTSGNAEAEKEDFFDAQAQEGAVWVIALGGAMAAIGLVGGSYLAFPTM